MFYYATYNFANNKLKRGRDNAKLSALTHLSLYFGFFTVLLISIIGLIDDNSISQWTVSSVNKSSFIVISAGILNYIVFGYRYYKGLGIEGIEKKIENMSKAQRSFYKSLTVFLQISVPICLFVFYRLYKFGHIRWW